jgi:hypothetical protein
LWEADDLNFQSSGNPQLIAALATMDIELSSVLKAIGPGASIVFAAWLFMSYLQQRYSAAFDRYREMAENYRSRQGSEDRRANIKNQINIYRKRCMLMGPASTLGLCSAIVLTLTLIIGEFNVIFQKVKFLEISGSVLALIGLLLVIVASSIVIWEGFISRKQLDSEILDDPDLAYGTGQKPGKMTEL